MSRGDEFISKSYSEGTKLKERKKKVPHSKGGTRNHKASARTRVLPVQEFI